MKGNSKMAFQKGLEGTGQNSFNLQEISKRAYLMEIVYKKHRKVFSSEE